MSTEPHQSKNINQQPYFQVSASVKICIICCKEEDCKLNHWPVELAKSDSLELIEALRSIEYEFKPILRLIGENNRPVEQYIRSINKRIDLIALHLNRDNNDPSEKIQQVKISEGNMDFISNKNNTLNSAEKITTGSLLAIELTLLPSHAGLSLFGKIVEKTAITTDTNRIRVDFYQLRESDRQQLAKYVMQKQLQDKRNK